ncbi:type II toxin-antitoxin system antitoxin EndoAI [Bacillus subtilis]|uniref:Type II toxin-antitoxin system antitoxin EndoAI n=1 Tax=Bacillus subtilis TaxID=1423 RepID=A0A8I2B5I4_BACIU|nr:type II toxin-antitoxin system antitoxin EndoAI [Bacillus subtilis]KAF2421374.1 antitoxin endoai [Bacillus subtilis]MBO3794697.1 type II toxin-antitoxin system antitoxin EndoAI [Bacillus subtilis]TWG81390.1 CopG family transcriptional regulator/antitoxin EndoAI [Bacillus subtilis J27]
MSESSARTEMKISLPENLVAELDGVAMREKRSRNELITQAVRAYVSERTTRHNRDLMRRGYMEMAKINLNISSEAHFAECEAETTVERLVSGG